MTRHIRGHTFKKLKIFKIDISSFSTTKHAETFLKQKKIMKSLLFEFDFYSLLDRIFFLKVGRRAKLTVINVYIRTYSNFIFHLQIHK